MTKEIKVSVSERVATVMIDREERRNALSSAVVEQLIEALQECSAREDVGVVVLTGAGERVFCAGGDFMDQQRADGMLAMHEGRESFARLLLAMQRCACPLIARINGHALGGGFGLALQCDLIVAHEGASFGMPEIKVGLFPMMITAVVSRNIGRKRAMEMMLTGERLSVARAHEWGIVNRVCERERLDEEVAMLAARITCFSPATLSLGRRAFYKTQDMSFEQALDHLHNELTIASFTEDASEGVLAFLGKREPEWSGR